MSGVYPCMCVCVYDDDYDEYDDEYNDEYDDEYDNDAQDPITLITGHESGAVTFTALDNKKSESITKHDNAVTGLLVIEQDRVCSIGCDGLAITYNIHIEAGSRMRTIGPVVH